MAGFHALPPGWFCPARNDARYRSSVRVHYSLHPFFTRGELAVTRRYGVGNVEHVEVQVEEGPQAVPVWMVDQEQCCQMTMGLDPQCSLASLLQLRVLLEQIRLSGGEQKDNL
jgi:hypothetical protein